MPSILEMVCVCLFSEKKQMTVIWEEKGHKFLEISGRALRMQALENMRHVNVFDLKKK